MILQVLSKTPMQAMNMTSFGSTWSAMNIMPLLVMFTIVLALALVVSVSFSTFTRFVRLGRFLGRTFTYFLKGILMIVCVGLPMYAITLVNAAGLIDWFVFAEWSIVAVLGFFGIAGLGYLGDRFWKRMKTWRTQMKQYESLKTELQNASPKVYED